MSRFKHLNILYFLIFAVIVCFAGCDTIYPPFISTEAGVQPETFPGLVQEEWFFFNPDKSFHHFEVFTYQYDQNGRRTHGDFFHSETGISLVLNYNYDSEGRLIGEHWESPDIPGLFWELTYRYNENKTRILGGQGEGFYTWDFAYDYDSQGRRSSTAFTSDDPRAPRFTLHHQYDDRGRCILATGTEQRGLSIVIVYTYMDTDAKMGNGYFPTIGPGPQPETFPGLTKEEWYFFDKERNLDHYEILTYQYNQDGRRIRGEFLNSRMEIPFGIDYDYDTQGKVMTEQWGASGIEDMSWTFTYHYDADGTRIIGGEATGFFNYEMRYEYDTIGRRIGTTVAYFNPPGGYTLSHQYDEQGRVIRAVGTETSGLRIIIVYT